MDGLAVEADGGGEHAFEGGAAPSSSSFSWVCAGAYRPRLSCANLKTDLRAVGSRCHCSLPLQHKSMIRRTAIPLELTELTGD